MDITEQIAELRAKLEELERQTQEGPKPLLTGPCIAKTRTGDVVPVQRNLSRDYNFSYRTDSCEETVTENGDYFTDDTETRDYDIVEVIRSLTEQEVLDWQFRGIEPDLNEARDVVAEGFEHSDVGRKEAEEMGLAYLGEARENTIADVPGTLYWFTGKYGWESKENNTEVFKKAVYAYKPSGE